ncbi:MAG: asparagine synthase (glutamine-hydrolyzing) [Tepidisphaeraceae bacterium]|jgi:asparagine synthase (glutamine-hydrolysing)
MCGFAGVVAWDERYRICPESLRAMGNALAHRGPDGQDHWISHQNSPSADNPQCALTFARLAILDLDRRAMQPMTDGRRWLVFNGEIYNFRQLRDQLDALQPGRVWKTTGDSEVLLAGYDAWGESCLDHFNGMFAFAIWDSQTRTLFLARDRMGQKPLFVAVAPDYRAVAFASELGAMRALSWPDTTVDPVALTQYLHLGYISAPATIYRGIAKLPPANCMTCRGGQIPTTGVYFDPNQPGQGEAADSRGDFRSAILTAVQRQLVADVPVGCFLSGGVDSSVIAAAMKSLAPPAQRVLTFSIGFDDPRYDESKYAAAVAKHLGTEHREFIVRLDANQVAQDLPRLAAVFGEPFADSSALPTHYLAQQTRQHVKVALSGDGGDELFGGYDRYRAMHWGFVARLIPPPLRRAVAALPSPRRKSALARWKRFLRAAHLPPPARYGEYVALFSRQELAALFPGAMRRDLLVETFQRLLAGRDVVQAALATDRVTYLPEDLLTKVDRASMLHGLEVRCPFMDHQLVHRAAVLSTAQILGGRKRMLKQAFAADLPPLVFRRPKMGFAVPIGDWLRGPLRPMMHDLLTAGDSFCASHFEPAAILRLLQEHRNRRSDHSQRLYALIMLELWWRRRTAG